MPIDRSAWQRDDVDNPWHSWLDRLDRDPSDGDQWLLSRWIFLRLLAVVHFFAFWSLSTQIIGLVGVNGVLPATEFRRAMWNHYGVAAVYHLPTLGWINVSDIGLQIFCWLGMALSIVLFVGVAPLPTLGGLWFLYLSLTVLGQSFLSFQWDSLLLETTLMAMLWAPRQMLPQFWNEDFPSTLGRWVVWSVLVKLMVLSCLTKVLAEGGSWINLTALDFHFETQPLPTPMAWYFHNFPLGVKRLLCAAVLLIELLAPLTVFVPAALKRVRYAGCGALIVLQLIIALTGNYGFFNWLTIILCLTMLDDSVWQQLLVHVPARLRSWLEDMGGREHLREPIVKRSILVVATALIVLFSGAACVLELLVTSPKTRELAATRAVAKVVRPIAPFQSINGYGLFRKMTDERQEIVLQGTNNRGLSWDEYVFRYKPGPVGRRPSWVQPHMPRLDWLMWFAPFSRSAYLDIKRMQGRVLLGSDTVEQLIGSNPYAGQPPQVLRLVMYRYKFTRRGEGDNWWTREELAVEPGVSIKQEALDQLKK